jgi:chromosome segregation ATPase
MDVDTYFAPPDPSGEVPVPVLPTDPPRRTHRARTAVIVAGAVVAVAGVFVLGRWTTGGERDALTGERDAAQRERTDLVQRVDELERDMASALSTNDENESTIADLEAAAADDAAELNRLRTAVAVAADRNGELEDSNRELWTKVDAVSECSEAVTAAETALEKWNAMLPVLDEYLQAEPGSPEETDAGERLDQAFLDIDDAETGYTAASTRCTASLEALPACDAERMTMEVAVEAFIAKLDRQPATEQELVTEGFIRQPSGEYDLTNGEVTPARGSVCPSVA